VQDLLDRAGGRAELLIHFATATGYELVDWNRAAMEIFDLPVPVQAQAPQAWDKLPAPLAEYLSQAIQAVSGAPEEAMPGFKHPSRPDQNYFA